MTLPWFHLGSFNPVFGFKMSVSSVKFDPAISRPDFLHDVVGFFGEGAHQLVEHGFDFPFRGGGEEGADFGFRLFLDEVDVFHNRIKFNRLTLVWWGGLPLPWLFRFLRTS